MSHLDDFLNDSTPGMEPPVQPASGDVIDLTVPAAPDGPPITDEPAPAGFEVTDADTPEIEVLLQRLIVMVEEAKTMPLSASSMINKAEFLAVLHAANDSLPDELRAARWLLKEREDFLAKTQRDGEELVAVARTRAEQMVQRTELVRQANTRARQIVEAAEAESRTMKREAEDYCDQKLASFEGVLNRTLKVVGEGRVKLQGDVLAPLAASPEPEAQAAKSHEFFTGEMRATGPDTSS